LQKYLLELDGRAAGKFFAFSGGAIRADVVQTSAPAFAPRKHIASVRFGDMTLTCGTGMSHEFYDWIGSGFGGASSRKTGAIVALDQPGGRRLEFSNALVSSLVLPELDRSSNKTAVMSVNLSPEFTRSVEQTGSPKTGVYASNLPKAWDIHSFRLRLDGLENECTQVTHIDSVQLGRKIVQDNAGAYSSAQNEASSTAFSNLVIRLPEMYVKGFYKWFDDFVVNGNSGSQSEKKGTLEFFAPNSTKAYFQLAFDGLGIFQLEGGSGLRSKTSLPITVGMYCNSMKFSAGPAAVV
jgi:T4-like virus tail tube protein gp19